jgi:SAM-dependent methyltransferase
MTDAGTPARDEFPWPPLEAGGPTPVWDGRGFTVGGARSLVLEYSRDESGWDAGLTDFHEETASSDHPIDLASRSEAVRRLRASLSAERPAILEIGSSSGFLLPDLRRAFPRAQVIGSDAFPDALRALAGAQPGFPLLQFDLTRCPLPDACVDAVVALNVLEHIEDDQAALAQIARILKPNGAAYLEVPAGERLYDIYDELLHHHRRYSARVLRARAEAAGLQVEWVSHLGFLVFPLFVAAKTRNQRLLRRSPEVKRAEVARSISSSRQSRALALALAAESRLGRVARFPWGIRCLCLLRRRSGAVR